MLEPIPPARNVLRSWQQALRLVRSRSTPLRISRHQVDDARGQARQVLSHTLPTLTANAGINRHLLLGTGVNFGTEGVQTDVTIPDPATTFSAGLELRQPLLALRTWHDIGTARRNIRAAELRSQDAERIILADVAGAAAIQITAERVADVSRVALSSALSTLELTRRRAALGAASKLDELRAEQEVSASRAQVITANEDVRRAREELGRTLVDDRPWGTALPLDQLERTARTVCKPVQNIEARSDIEAKALGVEIGDRNVSSVDYSYAPTVDLVSRADYVVNEDRSQNGKHVTWTVGAFLTWPLYDGGFRYGERTRAEAAADIAREELGETKRVARIDVTQRDRAVSVAMANLEVNRRAQQTASETARLARVAYINGSGTSFDLVDTASRSRRADITFLNSEFELIRAQIAAFLTRANCGL